MIVRSGTGFRTAMRMVVVSNWYMILVVLAFEILSLQIHRQVPGLQSTAFSAGAVGVLAGAVGVFLAFRFNEAYGRWWEARTLWGGMVNASRTFARQVATALRPGVLAGELDSEAIVDLHRELIYRQLAYVNALRSSLRDQEVLPEVAEFLEPAEVNELQSSLNIPSQLIRTQAERLAGALSDDVSGHLVQVRLDASLTELTALQGGLERIKNTAFPNHVIVATRMLVWAVAILVALAFIDPVEVVYLVEFAAILMIILSFKLMMQLGQELNDPFENEPNDTPMSALCRAIEIDLRQQLGETDLPAPLEAVDGVLM